MEAKIPCFSEVIKYTPNHHLTFGDWIPRDLESGHPKKNTWGHSMAWFFWEFLQVRVCTSIIWSSYQYLCEENHSHKKCWKMIPIWDQCWGFKIVLFQTINSPRKFNKHLPTSWKMTVESQNDPFHFGGEPFCKFSMGVQLLFSKHPKSWNDSRYPQNPKSCHPFLVVTPWRIEMEPTNQPI